MVEHDVLVSIDPRYGKDVAADWLVGIARIVLEMEHVGAAQVSIVVTDDEQVRALNREYAGDDHATDVLSFSLEEGEAFATPDDERRLGEIVISYETADRQARDAKHPTEDELAHLLVHGVLHLLGYDHQQEADEQRMRSRERSVLEVVGFEAH
jgi:probable rRNA maturation factor